MIGEKRYAQCSICKRSQEVDSEGKIEGWRVLVQEPDISFTVCSKCHVLKKANFQLSTPVMH